MNGSTSKWRCPTFFNCPCTCLFFTCCKIGYKAKHFVAFFNEVVYTVVHYFAICSLAPKLRAKHFFFFSDKVFEFVLYLCIYDHIAFIILHEKLYKLLISLIFCFIKIHSTRLFVQSVEDRLHCKKVQLFYDYFFIICEFSF